MTMIRLSDSESLRKLLEDKYFEAQPEDVKPSERFLLNFLLGLTEAYPHPQHCRNTEYNGFRRPEI
ncbi:hypothetical protein QUF80_21055 [Desulfococcaceae bacterium HSG8]|nr:hypothetical protein [Desulfococcaceae bacterium HSG8]